LTSRTAFARVGQQLGINKDTLRGWVDRQEIDSGLRACATSEEQRRISDLEREVRELRRANEILRSASAFFAAELDRPHRH
jgi:transposase